MIPGNNIAMMLHRGKRRIGHHPWIGMTTHSVSVWTVLSDIRLSIPQAPRVCSWSEGSQGLKPLPNCSGWEAASCCLRLITTSWCSLNCSESATASWAGDTSAGHVESGNFPSEKILSLLERGWRWSWRWRWMKMRMKMTMRIKMRRRWRFFSLGGCFTLNNCSVFQIKTKQVGGQ